MELRVETGEPPHGELSSASFEGSAPHRASASAGDGAIDAATDAEHLRRYGELERRLSALAAAAPVVLCTFRKRPDATYCMPYAAPGLSALCALAPEDVVDDVSRFFERIDGDDVARVRDSISASGAAMTTWHEQFRIRHPTRGALWVEGHSVPVREADGGVLWHGYLADVTARVELELRVRQSQKMEAIGLLAGGIAHDFNNLLTVIGTSTSLLRADVAPGDTRAELLDELQNAYERAASLTRQLLVFSRKERASPRLLDPDEVLRATRRLLLRVLGEDVRLVVTFRAESCRVHIDPGQLEQVLLNLAVNARDAMPRGGTLTVDSAVVEHAPRDRASGVRYRLSVTDTGCGMTAEVQARAFEPFFTTKGPGRGTGLGLATVYGIITTQGGSIELSSEPGLGTRFDVYLPVAGGDSIAHASVLPTAAAGGGETVLVVEDDDGVRRVARNALLASGYRVLDAASAAEALSLAAMHQGAVDLLLTDVVMPAMSGPELYQALRARRPDARVLYMSGHDGEAIHQHGGTGGATCVQKPFAIHALIARVREALDAPRR